VISFLNRANPLKSSFRKGYNDGNKSYEKNPEHAYEYSDKAHESSKASDENHKEKEKAKL
jgi:hypothetical protein